MATKKEMALFEEIVKFIPESIVMNASAYRNPKALQSTINNMRDKVIKEYISANPRKTNTDFEPIQDFLDERIMIRILVQ